MQVYIAYCFKASSLVLVPKCDVDGVRRSERICRLKELGWGILGPGPQVSEVSKRGALPMVAVEVRSSFGEVHARLGGQSSGAVLKLACVLLASRRHGHRIQGFGFHGFGVHTAVHGLSV